MNEFLIVLGFIVDCHTGSNKCIHLWNQRFRYPHMQWTVWCGSENALRPWV